MLRLLIIDLGLCFYMLVATIIFLTDVERNGYHWFKTPLTAAWLLIGWWALFFKGGQDAMDKAKADGTWD